MAQARYFWYFSISYYIPLPKTTASSHGGLGTHLIHGSFGPPKFTHQHTQPLVRDYPGRPVPEETLTHSHPSWSLDILYQLPPFTTIHCILCAQFMCLTVLFDNLSPLRSSLVLLLVLGPLLHTPCISSPSHHLLYAAHAHTNAACSAAKPMLCHLYLVSLSSLLGNTPNSISIGSTVFVGIMVMSNTDSHGT